LKETTRDSPVSGRGPDSVVEVSVRPRASRCQVRGVSAGRLRIEVCAAPEDGRATHEALSTLADALRVPVSGLSVLRGERSRHKTILIRGLPAEECRKRLRIEPR